MEYLDIFILGWNLNALMFVVNLFLAMSIVKTSQTQTYEQQREILDSLQKEFEHYYPNRKIETLVTYLIPFTAFYRVLFRIIEMSMFLSKNKGSAVFDYVVYKYQNDIEKAKNR